MIERGRAQPADPWSFRVEVEPGGLDSRRWLEQGAESPRLADEIGRLMEQSTFGVVGTFSQGLQEMARTGQLEQLCTRDNGDEVLSQLLRKIDVLLQKPEAL